MKEGQESDGERQLYSRDTWEGLSMGFGCGVEGEEGVQDGRQTSPG